MTGKPQSQTGWWSQPIIVRARLPKYYYYVLVVDGYISETNASGGCSTDR